MRLLTAPAGQAKMAKSEAVGNYLPFIMHLAPADLSGYNTCPMAGNCKVPCLNTAGRGVFNSVQIARIRRTKMFYEQRGMFFELLRAEINLARKRAKKLGKILTVRLNGTSDIRWEVYHPYAGNTIFQEFPDVLFYDYTKLPNRRVGEIPNYNLTFSDGGDNDTHVQQALHCGMNVATVFAGESLPTNWYGRPVIDGDTHDLRFLDPQGVVVGLRAKGKAKHDTSGFVKHIEILDTTIL